MNFCKIFVAALCMNIGVASAQSVFERLIQEKIREQRSNATQRSERAGDYSPPPSTEKPSGPYSSSDGKIKGDVDLKGIKVGMTSERVIELVLQSVSDRQQCSGAMLDHSHSRHIFADYIYRCEQAYTYFGVVTPFAEFYFIENKLVSARVGSFGSQNQNKDPLPPIVRSLSEEKFKYLPKLNEQREERFNNIGKQEFLWVDSQGDRLRYTTDFQIDLTGVIHKNGVINLLSSNFEDMVSSREAAKRADAKRKQDAVESQRKKDL
jgi:hypothetical protein